MDIREIANQAVTMPKSELTEGREKKPCDEMLGTPITILDYDIVVNESTTTETPKVFSIFVTEQYPEHYTYGGKILTDMFMHMTNVYGSIESANQELHNTGGLPVLLTKTKTKRLNSNGRLNDVVKVEVL